MPCHCSSHRRRKCGCKNAFSSLENPPRKWKHVNHPQDTNPEEDTESTSLYRKRRDDGTEKSCVCCICNKRRNDVSKTRLDEEGYHSAPVSMNQLHKPEEHEGRHNRRNKLRELLNENELEPIPEDVLSDGLDIKLEPEVLAAALLTSEDEEIDLSRIRPEDIFNKLFLGEESSPRNSQNVEGISVIVQGHSEPTSDTTSRDQEPQRLTASSTPYRNDNQNSRNLEVPAFGSPITAKASGADSDLEKNERQNTKHDLKLKSPFYGNRVQLNGSVKPSWFPGFTVVSPLIPEYVRITSDPMEGLRNAWRLCQPRYFDEVSKSLVNTG